MAKYAGISPKSRRTHSWAVKMMDTEEAALAFIRPFSAHTLQPVAIQVSTAQQRALFHYFRYVISSVKQGTVLQGMGRQAEWLLFDKKSGAFLGLWAFTDAALPWAPLCGWLGGWVGGLDIPERSQHGTANHMIQLKRCLPIYEFGDLTGGKLMALLAASKEVLKPWEYRYCYPLTAMYVTTVHGKSSQYNRLHTRGLKYLGTPGGGKGLYVQAFHENTKPFMLQQTTDLGAPLTYSYAEQVEYWKARWLPNRLGRIPADGVVRPDPERYRLSRLFRDKHLSVTRHGET